MCPFVRAILVLGVLACPAGAATRTFEIIPGSDDTRIRFDSKATLESFSGTTRRAWGHVRLGPDEIGDSIAVTVEVDMASLDTGIDKRNEDMRENHLETDTYPTARFEGARVVAGAGARLVPGTPVELRIAGAFTLHGVTRRIVLPVTLTLEEGGGAVRAESRFQVTLADYEIERPSFLFLKLAEEQTVVVDVVARVEGTG